MSSETIKDVIEQQYRRYSASSESENEYGIMDLTFIILRELYEKKLNKSLAPESYIFVECGNSIEHMRSMIEKIFLGRKSIDSVLESELDIIKTEMRGGSNSEELLTFSLRSEERIKQAVIRSRNLVHQHINVESDNNDKSAKFTNELIDMVDGKVNSIGELTVALKQSIEKSLMEQFNESLGTAIGKMVPDIVRSEVGTLMEIQQKRISREIQKSSAGQIPIHNKESITGSGFKTSIGSEADSRSFSVGRNPDSFNIMNDQGRF